MAEINRKWENKERVRQEIEDSDKETENKEDPNTVLPENNNNRNKRDSKQIDCLLYTSPVIDQEKRPINNNCI